MSDKTLKYFSVWGMSVLSFWVGVWDVVHPYYTLADEIIIVSHLWSEFEVVSLWQH